MGQEFVIKSQALEDKINQLLPSQGGFQPGVDLSASTTVIPIVDLTESAEGSGLRQDLQTALRLNTTVFDINGSTNNTIVNTTGYFRIFGLMSIQAVGAGSQINLNITDGTTTKVLIQGRQAVQETAVGLIPPQPFDFIIKIQAGEALRGTASAAGVRVNGCATQIADINGNLT